MKNTFVLSFITGFLLLLGSSTVAAQDGGIHVIPVELFTCTYNDGKGSDDLDNVIEKWNAWADEQGMDDYSAWTLTPYYFSSEQKFDVIWLGAGKDAVALGKTQDTYMAESAGLHDAFSEVVSCDAHVNYASINHKAPPDGATSRDGILTFSDCNFKEGATFAALGTAMAGWSQHLSDGGSNAAVFHWYPAYGGGQEEFDFKWLESHESLATLGADYERYGNGGGFEVRRNLLGHLIDCDSIRAYVSKNIRWVQLR